MKEIKFRAWDNVKNKMYFTGEEDEVAISFDSSGLVAIDLNEHDWGFKKLEHLQYMQFTGLKDKNGVEIYEGDILKSKNRSGSSNESNVDSVVFDSGRFIVRDKDRILDDMWINDKDLYGIEVIGNIFQNLKLLEESK